MTEAFDEEEKGSSQVREASSILNFEYHAIQLADEAQYKRHMFKEATSLPVKRVVSACFPVSDRLGVLELAISLFWNRIASVNLKWTLDFHGLKPTVPEIVYQEGEAFYRLDVDAASRSEYWQPSTTVSNMVSSSKSPSNKPDNGFGFFQLIVFNVQYYLLCLYTQLTH